MTQPQMPPISARLQRACQVLLNAHNKIDQQFAFELAKEELGRLAEECDALFARLAELETPKPEIVVSPSATT